jgi:hypothetical protein
MLSSIFIALFQAVAGDPAAAVTTETPAAEAAEPAAPEAETQPTTHTERRRVCQTYPAATGGRLATRRCRLEDVEVEGPAPQQPGVQGNVAGAGSGEAAAPTPGTSQQ